MATIRFTSHLVRHRPAPVLQAVGDTVAEVLHSGFDGDDLLRSYVLDEQGRLRKHVNIYLDGNFAGRVVQIDGSRGVVGVERGVVGGAATRGMVRGWV